MTPETRRQLAAARVPRYTSYPTAPHFSPAVDEATYRNWLQASDPAKAISLYLHIPFCKSLCWYCGCYTKIPARFEPIANYLTTLEAEIGLVADALPERMAVAHLHWGGGTPTIIGAEAFGRLMDRLRQRFDIRPDVEHAIEIDPRRLDGDIVHALADAGMTRASLGVQTFDPSVQDAINRRQSFEQTRDAALQLRAAGIEGLNIDLVYGLPHQTLAACRETVARILELNPSRIAVFGYAHVPAVKPHQRKIDEAVLPGEFERQDQAETIAETLVDAGFTAIGLDHFAIPGDELAVCLEQRDLRRNFQGYTADRADILIGLGASAVSVLPQGYAQNSAQLATYHDAIKAGRFPTARGIPLADEDRFRREIITDLMCYLHADLDAIAARHRAVPTSLDEARKHLVAAVEHGIARWEGNCLIVPEEHRALVRIVASAFDTYLDKSQARHSVAV